MKKTMVAVALSAFIITGCASDISNTQKGAGIGAVLGALAGKGTGDNDKKRYVWGAALGALAGGAIGSYMDKQEDAFREDTLLVSIMQANNEIGVIQDIEAIGNMTRQRGILFHVDAAQSVCKMPIDLKAMSVDLMSFSGHKVYGPKGVGALYLRNKPQLRLDPLCDGGGHERALRPGTIAVHQVAGMGKAFEVAKVVMKRRNIEFSEIDKAILEQVFEDTKQWRKKDE